jgi:hypothetical protein
MASIEDLVFNFSVSTLSITFNSTANEKPKHASTAAWAFLLMQIAQLKSEASLLNSSTSQPLN